MRRSTTLPLLVLGLCAAVTARAEAQQAQVERRGAPEVSAVPGETLTLPFRVTNRSPSAATVAGDARLPAGWRTASASLASELAPGQSELRLVGIGVPAGAGAGRHVVVYEAGGARDSAVVIIPLRRRVRVEPEDGPSMVIAGLAYAASFRVSNQGNAAERVHIYATADGGTRPAADLSAVDLAPGTHRMVLVTAPTNARTPGSARHQVTLRAVSDDSVVADTARRVITLVPRGAGRVTGGRLPVEVRVRASDSLTVPGFALSAAGPLNPSGSMSVDLQARSADPAGTPFARPDEYRLRLTAPGADLRVGDGVYALSPLTAPAHYGAGASLSLSRGWMTAGAVGSTDRRGSGQPGFVGGFARVGGQRAGLGLSFAAPDSGAARWAVGGRIAPWTLLSVDAEAGPAADSGGPARSVRVRGSSPRLSYEGLHQRGAPSVFPGRTDDQDFASVSLRPAGALQLAASVRRGEGGWSWLGGPAQRATHRRAALGWGNLLLVEARDVASDSAGPGDLRSVRARIGIPIFRAWLHPSIEMGEQVTLRGETAPFRVLGLQATGAAAGASLWAFVQVREGATVLSTTERELSGALTAAVPLGYGTTVRLMVQGRRGATGLADGTADLALERRVMRGHRLSLRGMAMSGTVAPWRPRLEAEYTVPLGVPLPSRGDGRVVARLTDAETGRGIPDALVRLGTRLAVTDRHGVAGFAGVEAGVHALRMEPTPGPERVAGRDVPLTVAVTPGEGARVEIGLTRAGRITGIVRQVPPDSAASTVPRPMAGVEIVITGPQGTHRGVTDAEGRFVISGVRPGWWRVTVPTGGLPRHHQPAEEPIVQLRPGGDEPVELRVIEKRRAVQMVQPAASILQ